MRYDCLCFGVTIENHTQRNQPRWVGRLPSGPFFLPGCLVSYLFQPFSVAISPGIGAWFIPGECDFRRVS